ncbi:MAG: hypothetical protein JXB48_13885 [Candidatus Latescibacteria bacterium]|nr:hypothetical protein [Candidatus Latescibacterota bacterium]
MNRNHTKKAKYIIALLTTLLVACVFSAQVFAAEWSDTLNKIKTYKFGDSREPLSVIEDYVVSTSGDAQKREQLEQDFAKLLRDKNTSLDCKDFICRQLWVIGTGESVSALENMLTDAEMSDMARYALERNTTPEAAKTLRNALKKAEGMQLIGIVNSLGEKRDTESTDSICGLVFAWEIEVKEDDENKKKTKERENEMLSLAAINALGKIGGEKAMSTLAEARRKGTPRINQAAAAAILTATDNLSK